MKMCGNKKTYDKKTALTVRNRRLREGVEWLRAYHCPKCNFWHLTHGKSKRRYGE